MCWKITLREFSQRRLREETATKLNVLAARRYQAFQ